MKSKRKKLARKKNSSKLSTTVKSPKLKGSEILSVKRTTFFREEGIWQIGIFCIEDQMIYQIDGLASYLWCLINGKRSVDEILRELRRQFSLSPKTLDLAKAFIDDAFQSNLIGIASKQGLAPATERGRVSSKLKDLTKSRYGAFKLECLNLDTREVYVAAATSCGGTNACHGCC